jgi:hypothetical protein
VMKGPFHLCITLYVKPTCPLLITGYPRFIHRVVP